MNTRSSQLRPLRWVLLALATLGWIRPSAFADQNVTQTFNLRAGWNAIWIEVEPTTTDPATVFSGVPITAAWTFSERLTSTDFIQSTTETIWNRSAWLSYVPAARPESINNNLFAIQGARAYLIHSQSAATLNVTGRPNFRALRWVENAYNLLGFPVDPAIPPSFGNFFGPSPAHVDPATGALTEAYRLAEDGSWQRVLASDPIQHGVAYWVFSRGASTYQAPAVASQPVGNGLDYSRALKEIDLGLANFRGTPTTFALRELNPSQPSTCLAEGLPNAEGVTVWSALASPTTKTLAAGASSSLRMAVQRKAIASGRYESVLEAKDGAGVRYLLPVTADRINEADEARSRAGLWIGTIRVNAVSDVHSGNLETNQLSSNFEAKTNGTSTATASTAPLQIRRVNVNSTPVPTRSEFNLRVLIHVDANGVPRLLREVTQMWQDGTYTVDSQGRPVAETPGRFVLVTDERRIPALKGATLRDGEPVGRRISAIGFDFPVASPDANHLPLTGTFAAGETISGTIDLSPNHSTNPFRHRYHPDHDNLAGDFRTPAAEAFSIRRQLEFNLLANHPDGPQAKTDYGYDELSALYFETVTGLHQYPIRAQGTVTLKRISEIASLNP